METNSNCKLEEGFNCNQNVADTLVSKLGGQALRNLSTGELSVFVMYGVEEIGLTDLFEKAEQNKESCGNTKCEYHINHEE